MSSVFASNPLPSSQTPLTSPSNGRGILSPSRGRGHAQRAGEEQRWTGDLATVVGTMLMGSSYPFAKEVLAAMSPLLYGASRYLVAGVVLMAAMVLAALAPSAASGLGVARPPRLAAPDRIGADRRHLVPGLLEPRHCPQLAQPRRHRHDHDDGLLRHPGVARRPPPAGARLGRHRRRLRGRRAGGEQQPRRGHARRPPASRPRCSGWRPLFRGRSMSSAAAPTTIGWAPCRSWPGRRSWARCCSAHLAALRFAPGVRQPRYPPGRASGSTPASSRSASPISA